jgi:hypothetical protein
MFRKLGIGTAAALTVLAVTAAPAGAAVGELTLTGPSGSRVMLDPDRGCYDFPFNTVTNKTDTTAIVYEGAGCTGANLRVGPGGQPVPVGDRLSVFVFL